MKTKTLKKLVLSVVAVSVWLSIGACGGKSDSSGSGGKSGSGGGAGNGGGGGSGGGSGGGAGNGGSGGGSGGSSGTGAYGATGGSGGASLADCQKLEDDYEAAIVEAKVCNPLINTLLCTQLVYDKLACGCPTYVNPSNTQAAVKMSDLSEQWKSFGCDAIVGCEPVDCAAPQTASCQPDATGTSGNCHDMFGG